MTRRRIRWVDWQEWYPVRTLDTDAPDLPAGLKEDYERVMSEFHRMQETLRELEGRITRGEWPGPRKVNHPAVPDDSVPLPYEEYDYL